MYKRALYCCVTLLFFTATWTSRPAKALPSFPSLDDFQTLCQDTEAVGQIMLLYQSVVAGTSSPGPATGLQFAASFMANTVPRICSLVVAVANARDTESTLRAVRIANNLGALQLDTAIGHFEKSVSLYQFLDRLAPISENSKEKLLNINNHRRALRFAKQWIFPTIKKLSGVELSKKAMIKGISKSRARASRANLLRDRLAGCRDPMSSSKPKGNEVEINGRKYNAVNFKAESDAQPKHEEKKRGAIAKARQFREVILEMVSKVVTTPEDFVSAQSVVDNVFTKGYWVSVEYAKPNSTTLTPAKSDVREAPGGEVEIVEDPSSQEYTQQIGFSGRACSNIESKQWHFWIMNNSDIINDFRINPSFIAGSVRRCPTVTNIRGKPLETIVAVSTEAWIEEQNKKWRDSEEQKCRQNTAEDALKGLSDLKRLGSSDFSDRSRLSQRDPGPLCPEPKNPDIPPPDFFAPIAEMKTLNDFIEYFNEAFSRYVEATTSVSLKENPVSDFFRSISKAHGSMGDGGGFDAGAGNRYSKEQLAIISKWRRLTRCDNPTHLEEKYNNSYRQVYSNEAADTLSESERAVALAELLDRCRRDETAPEKNESIFEDMFDGMLDELRDFNDAEAKIVQFELNYGVYKSSGGGQKGCIEELRPNDVAKIGAQLQQINVEQSSELIELLRAAEQRRLAKENQSMMAEKKREQKFMAIKQSLIKNGLRKTNAGSYETGKGELEARDNMLPNHVTGAQREKDMKP